MSRSLTDVELLDRRCIVPEGQGLERVRLRRLRHDGGTSDVLERFVVGAGHRAVSVLAWDPTVDKVVLIEQFRTGAWLAATDVHSPANVSAWMLEVVAGTVDKNEQPAESARRELFEEAGCIADELIHVATWCPDPEQSAATMTLFATRTRAPCTETLRSNSHEQEDLHVRLLGCADVEKELTFVSRIGNATTLIGLQWFVNRGRAVLAQT